MFSATRLMTMTLIMSQALINPIYTLPSSQLAVRVASKPATQTNVTSTLRPRDDAEQNSPPSSPNLEQNSHEGDGTFYSPGLGSCGIQNKGTDLIVAISHTLYDSHQGQDGAPNDLCGRQILVTFGSKSITVGVVDRCEGCAPNDLDFSPAAFRKLSPLSVGRLHDIEWSFV